MQDRDPRNAMPERPKKSRTWPFVFSLLILVLLAVCGVVVERTLISEQKAQTVAPSAAEEAPLAEVPNASTVEEEVQEAEEPEATDAPAGEDEAAQAPEAPAAPEAAPQATHEPCEVNVMMIGDILMHDELVAAGMMPDGSFNYDFLYREIRPWIDEADLRILNQETVMGEPERGYWLTMGAVGPIMNTPTAVADAEAAAGFNCILKATNHTLDLGYSGLAHELDYWHATYPDIPIVGVNNPNKVFTEDSSENYVDNVYVFESKGIKIAILNYTWATNLNFDWNTDVATISYLSEEKIRSDVDKARAGGADVIIACPHWGIQYDTEPSDEEYYYSKLFCDLGVDVIFGCHPHILQRVELLRNESGHPCVCFYSMSDYVAASIMDASSLIGGIARVTIGRGEDGSISVCAASLIPTVVCHTTGQNMTAFPLAAWTQELCDQGRRPQLTPQWCYDFCASVLGDGFSYDLGFYALDLNQEGRYV